MFIFCWIVTNLALEASGPPADRPPFQILQDQGEALGLYVTILILITQRRADEIAQHREQLTLQLALVGERKNAKIIQLLEELRRDNPLIHDRIDPQAEALSVPADPQAVLDATNETQDELLAGLDVVEPGTSLRH